ncbi:CRTAC1 family protein [Rhodohalobacter sp. 614A]|uniref:CRTAC1 family protein n=1 Tax=Rhodohalobacter sp. 614A TaxID=2908649 RepID=UPI001F28EC01|nr:CRTAC1 family protein [Rhodohalobacter sp. 614A]
MKKEHVKKSVVILIFLILVSIPFGMKKYDEFVNSEKFENRQEIIDRYGFFLEDVTDEIEVDFVHKRPIVDEKLDHIAPQIASMGASVSVTDFNNDGYQDFYLTNSEFGTKNALYKNFGNGTFIDVAEELGIADLNSEQVGASMGSLWADYNNDGFEDLFIYRWGKPVLFKNNNGEGFSEVAGAGFPEHINANTATWIDYNRDGLLDLFIGGYYKEDVNLFDLESTQMMPDSYEYATNGGLNYLFENQGNDTFLDVSEKVGLQESRRWTLASSATDINDSGYPDLVLANDYGVDEIYINNYGESFTNVGEEAGIGFAPKSGMSVSFGDVLNQGKHAIYITNISESGVLMQGNNLWVPSRDDDTGETPAYRNLASNLGVEIGNWGYSGQFLDFNNDGNLDLYVANGYVSATPDTDYWYDYAKVVGGNRSIIIDANNWPAMENRTFSGYQANKLWLNDGAGRFQEVGNNVGGALELDSRSVAYADFFGNGSLDLIVANQDQPVKVYRNYVDPNHNWIGFDLEGTKSNRSAIGAIVILHWDGKQSRKSITAGEAFSSQSQRPLYFGLGDVKQIEKVEIRWPSGIVQVIDNPVINQKHLIEELSEEN